MTCNKHLVLIASGGRTGTQFLGDNLSKIITDCFSVHEPDMYKGICNPQTWQALYDFGFYHMIIGRILGKTGIRNLNQQYLTASKSDDALIKAIKQHRTQYLNRKKQGLIIESYYQWFGLYPLAEKAFPHVKFIGIIRDPRNWITSWMNHINTHHTNNDWVNNLGFSRLSSNNIKPSNHLSSLDWKTLSPFEKNCWDWAIIAEQLLHHDKTYEQAKLFRFEDLFLSENKQAFIEEMLEFATNFPDKSFPYEIDMALFSQKQNASKKNVFSSWKDWSPELCQQLDHICGPLMRELGYGAEPQWHEKLQK